MLTGFLFVLVKYTSEMLPEWESIGLPVDFLLYVRHSSMQSVFLGFS